MPHLNQVKCRAQERRERALAKRKHTKFVSRDDRVQAARAAQVQGRELRKDIQQEWDKLDIAAVALASKYGKKTSWMQVRLQRLPHHKKQHGINKWNALVHMKSLEINNDVPAGQKASLQELQKIAKAATKCSDVSEADLEKMKECLKEAQQFKARGIRTYKHTRDRDIKTTAKSIREELTNLDVRSQMASLFVTVRASSEHTNAPEYYIHSTIQAFIETVLGMTIDDFCLKLDAFSILGLKGLGKNDNERKNILKKCIRLLVNDGLSKVTEDSTAKMRWKNYEQLVMDHRVVLEGWPNATFDPSNLGLRDLEVVLATLTTKKCAWRKLTDDEFKEREAEYIERLANGTIDRRKRKKRSDAGKKRKRKAATDSSESDSELPDSDIDEADTNGGSTSRRQKRRRPTSSDNA